MTKETWKDIHPWFSYLLRKKWEKLGMNYVETKQWIDIGFSPDRSDEVENWKKNDFDPEEVEKWIRLGFKTRDIYKIQAWTKAGFVKEEVKQLITIGFQPDENWRAKQWKERQFNLSQIQEWIKTGAKPEDSGFCAWLRDKEKVSIERLNYEKEKEKYQKHVNNFKLNTKTINQLKAISDFKQVKISRWSTKDEIAKFSALITQLENILNTNKVPVILNKDSNEYFNWLGYPTTAKYELDELEDKLINKLIPWQELKEKYEKYGLCQECNQPNYDKNWCRTCDTKRFQENFKNWTSGNQEIDKCIQGYQLKATNHDKLLEWIPYEQFTEVKYLAEGGFSKVYKAKWNNQEIVVKSLNGSQNATAYFLREVDSHKSINGGGVVKCFGISQDPKTKNYLIVMQYIPDGNLREYSKDNKKNFHFKLLQFHYIAKGLNSIHQQGLMHRDFHAGNILNKNDESNIIFCYITDLGLCQPIDEANDKKIFGVMPYVAPEVLNGKPYTQASDIYSFGIVAYEILSGLPPYYDVSHDTHLALKICQGLRPNLNSLQVPQLLKDSISKCWDADPLKRPTAKELSKISFDWYWEIADWKNTEICRQYSETETFDKEYKTHPKAIYTSRFLDLKNLPQPQNSKEINEHFYNLAQSYEQTDLLKKIKGIEKEINLLKDPLESETAKLVEDFIQAFKGKERGDEEARSEVKKLDKELGKNLPRENIKKIIEYCKELINLEKQQSEKEVQIEGKVQQVSFSPFNKNS